jgi:tRNA dimethylallyltransferase
VLEVSLLTGRPLSWWHRHAEPDGDALSAVVVLLEIPRDELYRRIEARADHMLRGGFVEEVETLLSAGHREDAPGMTGHGYREVAAYLKGGGSLDKVREEIVRATRRYARRQLTWFRHRLPADVVRVNGMEPLSRQVERIVEAWSARTERGGDA